MKRSESDISMLETRPVHDMPIESLSAAWMIWLRRRFIARVALLSAIATSAIVLLIPNRFQSHTRVIPSESQASGMLQALVAGKAGGLGSLAGDLAGFKSPGAVFVAILDSRTVQDRIVTRFDLMNVYSKKYWTDARKMLAKNTVVDEDRKSGVITITVTDRDPWRAAAMANSYVNELNHIASELNTSSAHQERVFIETRLKGVKTELDDASKDLSEFSSKNLAVDIKEQGRASVESVAILQGQLISAQTELDGLRQIYSDSNIHVKSVQARVQELSRQLNLRLAKDSQGIQRTDLYPSLRQLPLLGVQYADLYRRSKTAETVYELLNQQFELAKIQEARELPKVEVMDPADVPERKSGPQRTLIVLVSGFMSSLFAIFWVVGTAAWSRLSSSDSRKMLATEVYSELRRRVTFR